MILLEFIDTLVEQEGPRIPHPEDAIFAGSAEASKMIDAIEELINDPGRVTIKWDGGIALFFGKLDDKFVVTDKYMPAKGVYPTSPEQWVEYDQSRGANRADLYAKIDMIWDGLRAAVGNTPGLFKGDLMWAGELKPNAQGQYVFRPTTVEYRIPKTSALGRLFTGKVGGIVVHQYQGSPWDGRSGLTNAGNVAIISPTAGITFTLKTPVRLLGAARTSISKLGATADGFLNGLDNVAREALKKYANKLITKQTSEPLVQWLKANVSDKQYKKLVTGPDEQGTGYIIENKGGLDAVFAIWNAIYQLKDNISQQLEPQIKGFEQWTGGRKEGEGFVFPSSQGLIKIVNRAGFGAAHFAKTA
jgi:hypothetical protein